MLIYHDDDEWEPDVSHHTCGYHERHPGNPWAGCTCSSSYGMKRRDPAEVAKIKAERCRTKEDEILAEAERIKRRRGI